MIETCQFSVIVTPNVYCVCVCVCVCVFGPCVVVQCLVYFLILQ